MYVKYYQLASNHIYFQINAIYKPLRHLKLQHNICYIVTVVTRIM